MLNVAFSQTKPDGHRDSPSKRKVPEDICLIPLVFPSVDVATIRPQVRSVHGCQHVALARIKTSAFPSHLEGPSDDIVQQTVGISTVVNESEKHETFGPETSERRKPII